LTPTGLGGYDQLCLKTKYWKPSPCTLCSNGCMLQIKPKSGRRYQVLGNRCTNGVNYAEKKLSDQYPGTYESAKSFLEFSPETLQSVLERWGLELLLAQRGSLIQGSPERSIYRVKVICQEGTYILELLPKSKLQSREVQGRLLQELSEQGLPLAPPLLNLEGSTYWLEQEGFWQVIPYFGGLVLDRSRYWQEAWRGDLLGNILRRLQDHPIPEALAPPVEISAFIGDLVQKAQRNNPLLTPGIQAVLGYLQTALFPFLPALPLVLSHGDSHPLNVVWGENNIRCLIDWEFCGARPRIYDPALTLGCVGTEHPEALTGPFCRAPSLGHKAGFNSPGHQPPGPDDPRPALRLAGRVAAA
jgi:homoserine kinase type II